MSHFTAIARRPVARHASAVAATVPGSPVKDASWLRAAQTTSAPASASPTASARPMPRDAPVTIAT
jgi:hypothetical protein